jgi:hypothetical protein
VKLQNIQKPEDVSVRTPCYLVKLAHAFGLNLEEIYRLTSAGQKAQKRSPDDAARLARIIANTEPERYKAVELIAHTR